jgi:DNA-binding NarL/FixJ family response regulator
MLVDDHQMLREGLRILINGEDEMAVIGEAASGEEALTLMFDLNPDVVIMDLGLPGIGGLAAIKSIRDSSLECKIVVLTMNNNKTMISQSFKAGANGFVPKSTAHIYLLEAIRTVIEGERYLDPDAAADMAEEVADQFENSDDSL